MDYENNDIESGPRSVRPGRESIRRKVVPPTAPPPLAPSLQPEDGAPRKSPKTLVIVAVIVVVALLGFGYLRGRGKEQPASRGHQAVFLSNGQVYFGKIESFDPLAVVLTDVFYLQVNQPLQNQNAATAPNQPNLTLIKLGKELHGPKDRMEIMRTSILFIEELSETSQVLKAIREFTR